MSRNILPTAQAYLDTASSLKIAHLVRIDLAEDIGGSIYSYVTDYLGDLEWDGNTYEAGKVTTIGDITQTQGFINYKVKIGIAGEFQEELEKALSDYSNKSYIGRKIEILRAYIDDAGNIIPFDATTNGPMQYFKGEVASLSVQEDITKGQSTVFWECSGAFSDFELINGRITEDKAHRGLISDGLGGLTPSGSAKKVEYQSDTGFQHANRTVEATIKFTTTETRYKLKSSWFGLKSKMKTYEATVNNEVDLGINLSARYLPVVYGVRKINGIPIFIDVPRVGANKLYIVYAFCEGEIDGFLDIYIDGKPSICINSSDGASRACYGNQEDGDTLSAVPGIGGADRTTGTNHGDIFTISTETVDIRFTAYHGTSTQTANGTLVNLASTGAFAAQQEIGMNSEYWDANSKLLDTAYLVAEVPITEDQQEIPQIEAVIAGKRVSTYNSSLVESTNQYTLNPVWHLLEYVTNPIYGGNVPLSEIDLQSFYDVASVYDLYDNGVSPSYQGTWVKYWRYIGWRFVDGVNFAGDIPKLQCNTYLKGGDPVASNVKSVLDQMDGTLNILGNKYHLSIETDDAPIVNITAATAIGGIPTKDAPNKDKWNSIQATISDPAKLWQNNQITFFNSTYKGEDNGIDKKGNIGFPHITNYYTSRFWAERQLNKSRFSRDITVNLPPRFIFLYPNANVSFTYDRFKYTNKTFRVKSVTLNSDGKVRVVLKDYDNSIYAVTPQNDESSNQVPIVPVIRAPTNLEYIDIDSAPITASKPNVYGILCWTPSTSTGVFSYHVADWIDGDSRFTIPSDQTIEILGEDKVYIEVHDVVPDTEYTFRVRAVNHQGNVSKYTELVYTVGVGASPNELPAPSNLKVLNEVVDGIWTGSSLNLIWDLADPLEGINHYNIEIRSNDDLTLLGSHAVGPGADNFQYTVTLNLADYATNNAAAVGIYRDITPRIRSENVDASSTSDWVYLDDNN